MPPVRPSKAASKSASKSAAKPASKPKSLRPPQSSPSTVKLPTPFQSQVYASLLLIPSSQLTTYALLAKSLSTSPRAVGNALRENPFAPTVPCHRVIASNGFIGGFKGDWEKAPSGVNQTLKLKLLKDEGVEFDGEGKLIVRDGVWFDGPWDTTKTRKLIEQMVSDAN